MQKTSVSAMATLVALAGLAQAQPTVDGTLDSVYGAPLAVQANPTQFGDSNLANADEANGSELDAGYGFYDAATGKLHLFLAGNLETNFNKIDLFFDVAPGGQNVLRSNNVDIDFGGLNRMGGPRDVDPDGDGPLPPVTNPGLTFDAGFEADYWLTVTNGIFVNNNGTPDDPSDDIRTPANFGNAATLRTDGALIGFDYGSFSGGEKPTFPVIDFSGPRIDVQDGFSNLFTEFAPREAAANPSAPRGGLIRIAINNSNAAGVDGANVNDPAAVNTGIEIEADLGELGWDGSSSVRVVAFVNGTGHDFIANQVLGTLPAGSNNLGEPTGVDFGAIAGDQFMVIPELVAGGCNAADIAEPFGTLNIFDIFGFFNAFGAGDLEAADIDGNGSLNIFDIFGFFAAFGAGCP